MRSPIKTMRRIFLLLTLTAPIKSSAQIAVIDTTFLLKEYNDGVLHSIFIESDRNSRYYNYISDYSFDEFDGASFNESLDYLKSHQLELQNVSIEDIPRKWIILNQYKGEFYAYKPSDFYFHYKVSITDSAYVDFSGEGPSASKILSFQKMGNNTFQFTLEGMYSHGRELLIHMIDKKAGVAVFEDSSTEREKIYYLMVDADKIRDFPLIVNYCESQKHHEFDFDKPDFLKLIRQKH